MIFQLSTCNLLSMNILFIDTASKQNLLALCNEEKTLILTNLVQKNDSGLIPAIEKALEKAGMRYSDLTHLACAIGPGGFTSLRIGVTTMNTLSYSLELPSAGIHLSSVWAARTKQPCLWLHSTRRTQIFVKVFGGDGTSTPTTIFDLEEAEQLQGQYVGELIEEHQNLLTQCTPMPKEALLSLEEMLPQYLSQLKYRKQLLLPWYGRDAT